MKAKKRILIIVFMLLLTVIGGTFAWSTYRSRSTALVLTLGNFSDTKVVLSPYHLKEEMAPVQSYTDVNFTQVQILNDDSDSIIVSLNYKINRLDVELLDNGLKYTIEKSDELNGSYEHVITDYVDSVSDENYVIYNESIPGHTSVYYRIYIWLDSNDGDQTWTQGKQINIELRGTLLLNGTAPELMEGLIPIVFDEDDIPYTISPDDPEWYNYQDKKWANAVILEEEAAAWYGGTSGEQLYPSDILAYYVWIPRYKYKLFQGYPATDDWDEYGSEHTIDVVFESEDAPMSMGRTIGSYRTHPAFWWDDNNDSVIDKNETLAGIWVGKYETSVDTRSTCYTTPSESNCNMVHDTPKIVPGVSSLRLQNIFNQFGTAIRYSDGQLSADNIIFKGSQTYGLQGYTDSHMMKNSEWGAVSYLSQSVFGINGEVSRNIDQDYLTGCCAYSANTTGNITGVYDMSGGASEYVMGNYDEIYGSSGFKILPPKKYYDLYSSNTFEDDSSFNLGFCTLETCGGHALHETSFWYGGHVFMVNYDNPWFTRGGCLDHSSVQAGGLARRGIFEGAAVRGTASSGNSFRSVLIYDKNETVSYISHDLISGWDTSEIIGDRLNYSMSGQGVISARSHVDDAYVDTILSVYLEAGKSYIFNANTNAKLWGSPYQGLDAVYISLRGSTGAIAMDGNYNVVFSPSVTDTYKIRLHINVANKYYTFDTITISPYVDDARVVYGDSYESLPTPTRSGYSFLGWYTGRNGTGTKITNGTEVTVAGDHRLYAYWQDVGAPTCTLSVTSSGITFKSYSDDVVFKGLSTSSSPKYNTTTSLSLSVGTKYGYVQDDAGNTGKCSVTIMNSTIATENISCSASNFSDKVVNNSDCTGSGYVSYAGTNNCSQEPLYNGTRYTCTSSTKRQYSSCWCMDQDPDGDGTVWFLGNSSTYPTVAACSRSCVSTGGVFDEETSYKSTTTYSWASPVEFAGLGSWYCTVGQGMIANNACNASTVNKYWRDCTFRSYTYKGTISCNKKSCADGYTAVGDYCYK